MSIVSVAIRRSHHFPVVHSSTLHLVQSRAAQPCKQFSAAQFLSTTATTSSVQNSPELARTILSKKVVLPEEYRYAINQLVNEKKDVKNAESVLVHMLTHYSVINMSVVWALFKSLCQENMFDKAEELFVKHLERSSLLDKVDCYDYLLRKRIAYVERRMELQPKNALSSLVAPVEHWWQHMCDMGVTSAVTAGQMMNFYVHIKQYSKCLSIFESLHTIDISRNAHCFSIALEALIASGQENHAEQLFNKWKMQHREEINIVHYTIMISMYIRQQRQDEAESLLDDMESRNIAINQQLLTVLVKQYTNDKQMELAEQFLNNFITKNKTSMDIDVFNVLLKGYVEQSNWSAVKRLLVERLPQHNLFLNPYTTATMVSGFIKANNIPEAEKLIEFCLKENKDCINIVAINNLLYGYSINKDLDHALKFFNYAIHEAGMAPDRVTFETIFDICAACRRGIEATALFSLFQENYDWEPSSHACNSVLASLSKSTEKSEGQSVDQLDDFYNYLKQNNFPMDNRTYAIMLNGYVEYNQIHKAKQFFMANKAQLDIVSANTLIKGLVASKQLQEAHELLQLLIHLKMEATMVPNVYTFSSVINGYVANRNMDSALELFSIMIKMGIKPNEITLATLLNGYITAGKLDKAESLFEQMPATYGVEPGTSCYNTMLKGYFKKGDADKARFLLLQMENKRVSFSEVTFVTGIRGFLRSQLPLEAQQLAQKITKYRIYKNNAQLQETLLALSSTTNASKK